MKETIFEQVATAASVLKLDLSAEEFALFAEDQEFSETGLEAVQMLFSYLSEKKQQTTIQTLLKLSRLPTKVPKTFENFDFSLLKGKDVERLKVLASLNAIYSHRNLAFIGPAGTGKTHLAQAFGYACCQHGLKTYFIKASELRDRFTAARRSGKTDSCLNGLVRPSCLIIDEIGHCAFDKENTRLFFDLICKNRHPSPICTRFEHHFHALKPHLHRRSFSDTLPENQRHLIALKRHPLWHIQKLCQLSQPAELRSTFFRNRNAVLCQDVLQLSNPLALSLEFFLSCVKVFHRFTLHLVVAGPFQF